MLQSQTADQPKAPCERNTGSHNTHKSIYCITMDSYVQKSKARANAKWEQAQTRTNNNKIKHSSDFLMFDQGR